MSKNNNEKFEQLELEIFTLNTQLSNLSKDESPNLIIKLIQKINSKIDEYNILCFELDLKENILDKYTFSKPERPNTRINNKNNLNNNSKSQINNKINMNNRESKTSTNKNIQKIDNKKDTKEKPKIINKIKDLINKNNNEIDITKLPKSYFEVKPKKVDKIDDNPSISESDKINSNDIKNMNEWTNERVVTIDSKYKNKNVQEKTEILDNVHIYSEDIPNTKVIVKVKAEKTENDKEYILDNHFKKQNISYKNIEKKFNDVDEYKNQKPSDQEFFIKNDTPDKKKMYNDLNQNNEKIDITLKDLTNKKEDKVTLEKGSNDKNIIREAYWEAFDDKYKNESPTDKPLSSVGKIKLSPKPINKEKPKIISDKLKSIKLKKSDLKPDKDIKKQHKKNIKEDKKNESSSKRTNKNKEKLETQNKESKNNKVIKFKKSDLKPDKNIKKQHKKNVKMIKKEQKIINDMNFFPDLNKIELSKKNQNKSKDIKKTTTKPIAKDKPKTKKAKPQKVVANLIAISDESKTTNQKPIKTKTTNKTIKKPATKSTAKPVAIAKDKPKTKKAKPQKVVANPIAISNESKATNQNKKPEINLQKEITKHLADELKDFKKILSDNKDLNEKILDLNKKISQLSTDIKKSKEEQINSVKNSNNVEKLHSELKENITSLDKEISDLSDKNNKFSKDSEYKKNTVKVEKELKEYNHIKLHSIEKFLPEPIKYDDNCEICRRNKKNEDR